MALRYIFLTLLINPFYLISHVVDDAKRRLDESEITIHPLSCEQHAAAWINDVSYHLSPRNIQLMANIVYILYANSLIEGKIRQFMGPIMRLTQDIRANACDYKDATQEIQTLQALLDRLSYVLGARTVYNQMLQTCFTLYNNNPDLIVSSAIAELQIFGQQMLSQHAEHNKSKTAEKLNASAQLLRDHIEPLQAIANFHNGLAHDEFNDYFMSQETTKNIIPLAIIDELLKNNTIAVKNAENVVNILDNTTDYALQLINVAKNIYEQHYKALYEYISAEDFDSAYAVTLFGMNDLLSDEYKTLLPAPEQVFEHALQTVKLYTHIEVL